MIRQLSCFLIMKNVINDAKKILGIISTIQDFIVEIVTLCFVQLIVIAVSNTFEFFKINEGTAVEPFVFCLSAITFRLM